MDMPTDLEVIVELINITVETETESVRQREAESVPSGGTSLRLYNQKNAF